MGPLDLLPRSWRSNLSRARIEPICAGLSGASVFRVRKSGETRYLKIATGKHAEQLHQEIERTTWLASQAVKVPAVMQAIVEAELAAVLMTAVVGEPIEDSRRAPEEILNALASGLAQLHTLSVASCPFDESVRIRIARAEADIARRKIDPAAFHERNRVLSPKQLFDRLLATTPDTEDTVVVHGDATFTNLFIDPAGLGFIDCGHSGRADRYVDLALVAMEIEERFGQGWVRPFFKAYGFGFQSPDRRKLRFYSDLYELF